MDLWIEKTSFGNTTYTSGIAIEKIVDKTWGAESHIINDIYCMKELFIQKGASTSIHFHAKKHETILVIKGTLLVKIYNKDSSVTEVILTANEQNNRAIVIAPFLIHKLIALEEDVLLIEASTFSADSDSIRIRE